MDKENYFIAEGYNRAEENIKYELLNELKDLSPKGSPEYRKGFKAAIAQVKKIINEV